MVMHEMTQLDATALSIVHNNGSGLLEHALEAVEKTMFDVLDSDVPVLADASRHILAAGGKRVRPRLLMLTYFATGGSPNGIQFQNAARIGAAVEMVHTASVVHDDINDHGIMRRGRPSVNAIWGRTFALLAGDYLFTKVYELMAPFKDLNIDLAQATVALVEGETLQASAVKDNHLTREIYYTIIERKTAALFKSAAVMGAKITGSKPTVIDALGQFGLNIGLAFQIVDDILDLTATSEQLGKTAGIDVAQGKGFTSVREEQPTLDPMEAFKRKMLEGDRINEGYQQANLLVESAIALLDVLPNTLEKVALEHLARGVVNRSH